MLADFDRRAKNTTRSFMPEELVARAEKIVTNREGKQKIPPRLGLFTTHDFRFFLSSL